MVFWNGHEFFFIFLLRNSLKSYDPDNVREFWKAEAFSFYMILLKIKILLVCLAKEHFDLKKFVSWNFNGKRHLKKMICVSYINVDDIFFDKIHIIILPIWEIKQKSFLIKSSLVAEWGTHTVIWYVKEKNFLSCL